MILTWLVSSFLFGSAQVVCTGLPPMLQVCGEENSHAAHRGTHPGNTISGGVTHMQWLQDAGLDIAGQRWRLPTNPETKCLCVSLPHTRRRTQPAAPQQTHVLSDVSMKRLRASSAHA